MAPADTVRRFVAASETCPCSIHPGTRSVPLDAAATDHPCSTGNNRQEIELIHLLTQVLHPDLLARVRKPALIERHPLGLESVAELVAVRRLTHGDDTVVSLKPDRLVEHVLADARRIRTDDCGDVAVGDPMPLVDQLHGSIDQWVSVSLEPPAALALCRLDLAIDGVGNTGEVDVVRGLRQHPSALIGQRPPVWRLLDPLGRCHIDRAPADSGLIAMSAVLRLLEFEIGELETAGDLLDHLTAGQDAAVTKDLKNRAFDQAVTHPFWCCRRSREFRHSALDDAEELADVLGHLEKGHC